MRTALMAVAAVVFASLSIAAPAGAQGLSFPLPGEGEPSAAQPTPPASGPAVSPFRTESLSEQWNPQTNPPALRNPGSNCKDAATKMAEQSPTPPTSFACY
jgi:hypothetical protein